MQATASSTKVHDGASGSARERVPAAPSRLGRGAWALVGAGVLVRLALLWLAHPLDLRADEMRYAYLALAWNRFGMLQDTADFVWPPGMSWLLARGFAAFEADGVLAVKLLFVASSGVIGWSVARLALALFGPRAALVAAGLWAVHLPLAAHTHLLWPEPVYLALLLSALVILRPALAPESGPDAADRAPGAIAAIRRAASARLVAAGALLGCALYFKEVGVGLVPLLAVLAGVAPRAGVVEGLRRTSLLALAAVVVVAPWTLRNYDVYGRWTTTGETAGDNAYRGLNAHYKNFDTQAFDPILGAESPGRRARQGFAEPVELEPWPRAREVMNPIDRSRVQLRRGLAFAAAHPGQVAVTRVKRLADALTPLSFFVRHEALRMYRGPLAKPGVRRPLVAWAVLVACATMAAGLAGLVLAVRAARDRWLFGLVVGWHLAACLLISMSRLRVPVEPLLVVAAAGLLGGAGRGASRGARATAALGLGALVFLWWVDLPEVLGVLELAW